MSRTARLWRGAGFLMLGGVLLSGVSAFGADEPPISDQLTDLGRQALAQGASATAKTFFTKALAARSRQRRRGAGARSWSSAPRPASSGSPCKIRRPAQPPAAADQPAAAPPAARHPIPRPPSSKPRPPRTSPGSS